MRRLIFLSLLLAAAASAQLVPGVLRDVYYQTPADSGSWTYVEVGSGVCTSVTDVAGTLTITASGPDLNNGCLVYQEITDQFPSLNYAQVYGRLDSISGDAAATTRVGPIIANSTDADAAQCVLRWWEDLDTVQGNYIINDGELYAAGIAGTGVIPVHLGIAYTDNTNACQFFEYDTATAPASPATDFTGVPQPIQSYQSNQSAPFIAGFWVQSGHATNTATVTISDYEVQASLDLADNPPGDNLFFSETFDSGSVNVSGTGFSNYNNMYGRCDLGLDRDPPGKVACPDPNTYGGEPAPRCWYNQTCDGDRTHAYAYTVVTSDNGVTPRYGTHMLRYEVREKDYGSGDPPGINNERSLLQIRLENTNALLEYNKTYWVGLSRYMPSTEYAPNFTDTWFQFTRNPSPDFEHEIFIEYDPRIVGDTTATGYRARCAYYTPTNVRNKCPTTTGGVGYKNPFDAYYDEWMDFRVELKFHATNGVYKIWTRRPDVTSNYTLQVDYSGPLGWYNDSKVYRWDLQMYGGGNFPLVIYYDEIRFASEDTTEDMTDVDPPMPP